MAVGAVAANAAGGAAGSKLDLTRKIGPLPLWAWLGIGAAIGYYIYKRNQTAQATAAAVAGGSQQAAADTQTTLSPSGLTGGGPGMQYASNADWATAAADAAIQAGFNPTEVENAISNFLSGSTQDSQGEAILNWILQNFGSPPSGPSAVVGGGVNGGSGQPEPTSGVGSQFEPINYDVANALIHLTAAQKAELTAKPPSEWGNVPGINYNIVEYLTALPSGELAWLMTHPPQQWPGYNPSGNKSNPSSYWTGQPGSNPAA